MRSSARLAAIALAACLIVSQAAAASCPQHFFQGQVPALTNPKLAPGTRQLCYSEYALLHSGLTRTPLWVAEHLTPERIVAAHALMRVSDFHADPNIPPSERAELSDYVRSGFDRGHMAPSGDMSTPEAMDESFSLANMVPQNPNNNRNLWGDIERTVRRLAEQRELYVVTIPIFRGENLMSLDGRVLIPTQIAKAVYDPQQNAGAAYLVDNAPGDDYRVIALAELQRLAGIDAFPRAAPAVKETAMELPAPELRRPKGVIRQSAKPRAPSGPPAPSPGAGARDFIQGILDAIDRFGRHP